MENTDQNDMKALKSMTESGLLNLALIQYLTEKGLIDLDELQKKVDILKTTINIVRD